ncbi:ribonuclease H [Bifidobacterium subtile]|jgi:ribonuclease HI|uniref:ribonuclease H family protein n=1 Tax=Bifidobacterium subtile TaxID=77635 RepID=UPI002F35A3DB
MTITVSTDGSALGNPNGPMGWAWADHNTNPTQGSEHRHDGDCDAGGATNGTNQIGELCAVLEALRAHPGSEDLVIETDSQYAINCSTKWVHGWKKNGWKNSQKKPVKNAPLIKAIDAELSKRSGSVRFKWVKGHAGNAGNEKVDDLAHTYSGDARSGVKDGYLPLEGWQSLLASDYAKGVDIPADAQMLLDGKITAEEYHLGRGVASSANDDGNSGDNEDGDRYEDAAAYASDVASSRRKPSLEELLAEPEGVPDLPARVQKAHNSSAETVKSQTDASDTSADADYNHAHSTDAADDDWLGAGTFDEGSDETDDRKRVSGDDERMPDVSSQPSDDNAQTPRSMNPDTATSQIAAAGNASNRGKPDHPDQSTGLTLSGTLRFTPPPSSSATYDGRPRFIRGTVTVEGYVEGDGTIVLRDAPFAVDM